MTKGTSNGLRLFGQLVRWLTTALAIYVVWAGRSEREFFLVLLFAAFIFIVGNGFGWWVQVVAERGQEKE